MSEWWSGKRVCCTGLTGFVGKNLRVALNTCGAEVRYLAVDLRDPAKTDEAMSSHPIDVLFHLAADVGGIADNIARPAELFYNNVLINANVVHAAHRYYVPKLIALGSSCAYPHDAPLPLVESDYLRGEPEPTNAPYAYSKRLLLSHLQAAHTQYGLNYTYLILANLYGEGCDTDPRTAHVIGALVRKFYEAKRDGAESVTLWGTGKAVRDFLHVDDAVQALLRAGEHDHPDDVFNIGTGYGVSIAMLAEVVAVETGFAGRIAWDATKPDGQAKRVLNPSSANQLLRWGAHRSILDGIARTVQWYASTQERVHV